MLFLCQHILSITAVFVSLLKTSTNCGTDVGSRGLVVVVLATDVVGMGALLLVLLAAVVFVSDAMVKLMAVGVGIFTYNLD